MGSVPRGLDGRLLREIDRAVESRRAATVELLQELVRVPSVTGEERAVQAVVEQAFRERGLQVELCRTTAEEIAPYRQHVGEQPAHEDRPNVLGTRPGSERGSGRSLLLNAHTDTVAPGEPEEWRHGPFSGAVEDGMLYGRGACDMKGGLVSQLAALDALEGLGIRLRGDVTVAATVGEEDGGFGALGVLLAGYRADAAVICEPTGFALVPALEGSLVFRLQVRGWPAHAAVRNRGVSAFEKFLPLFEALRELERERNASLSHPLYDGLENKVPVNVGVVRSGDWASTVPESLLAECRVGFLPGEELEEVRDQVQHRIAAAAARDPWLRLNPPLIEYVGGQFVAAEVSPDAPLCATLSAAHRGVTGEPVVVEGATYGSDMRHFIHFGGMPCVMYGAGEIHLAHGTDERLSVEELLTATRTLAAFMVAWCGAEDLR